MMDAKDFPNTWRWTCGQIKAAERDPKTPQHIRDELRRMAQAVQAEMDSARDEQQRMLQAVQAEMDSAPGLLLYRANKPMLDAMAEMMPAVCDATLDEALGAADAVRSHSARTAAKAKAKGKPAWHAEAKRERDRLIQQGSAPRDIASKIARIAKFSQYGIKAIRSALK